MPALIAPKYYMHLFFNLIFILAVNYGFSQPANSISTQLELIGFENIRIIAEETNLYVTIENNVYRWDVQAITEAINSLSSATSDSANINLILLKNGIPYYCVSVNSNSWKKFKMGKTDKKRFAEKLKVTWETNEIWSLLKTVEVNNQSKGKIDVVVYPQFSFENTQLRKIYETQLNIAPSLEFSMWKGNKFTGQIIFPIHNELGYEGDFIRPGFVTISQEIRLAKNWFGTLSVGNFNQSRYGAGLKMWHPFQNENWNLEMNLGLTGYSHFLDNKWTHGNLNTITWSTSLSWYMEKYNIILKGGAARYIYNDMGLFAICTRYFGETAVGFYAQANEHNFNGGFSVSIPFPFKKRWQRKPIRFTLPNYYELNYNSGTELYYGQNFNANLNKNQIKSFTFTTSVRNEIINFLNHTP